MESYSASSREIKNDLMEPMVRQLTYLAIGVVTMIACSRINYTKYVNYGNEDYYDALYKKTTFAQDHNLSVTNKDASRTGDYGYRR